jgi:hypothetical protein
MLSSLFAVTVCALPPATDPLEFAAHDDDLGTSSQVGIHLTSTQFRVRSFSNAEHLLMLRGNHEGTPVTVVRCLPPAAETVWIFPRDTLTDIELDVASEYLGRWRHTGAIPLAIADEDGGQTLWIQAGTQRVFTWLQSGSDVSPVAASGSLLPPEWPSWTEQTEPPPSAPVHVPVPTPEDVPDSDTPPKLEEQPLPPI